MVFLSATFVTGYEPSLGDVGRPAGNVLWMYPLTLLPVSRQLHGHHEGEH